MASHLKQATQVEAEFTKRYYRLRKVYEDAFKERNKIRDLLRSTIDDMTKEQHISLVERFHTTKNLIQRLEGELKTLHEENTYTSIFNDNGRNAVIQIIGDPMEEKAQLVLIGSVTLENAFFLWTIDNVTIT